MTERRTKPQREADEPTNGKANQKPSRKREAIIEGALRIFAKNGYSRASIDAIAEEADVSTRTIYNHFRDKADLFQSLIQESATTVADSQIETMDSYLRKITDLESDLIDYGFALSEQQSHYPSHFALVRQINAEIGHIPESALRAWRKAGPQRVHDAFTLHIQKMIDAGWLTAEDAERAGAHFVLLVATEITQSTHYGAIAMDHAEVNRIITSGVRAFLRAYQAKPRKGGRTTLNKTT